MRRATNSNKPRGASRAWRRAPWLVTALSLLALPATAAEWEDKLELRSADERFSVRLGGRLHADVASIDYSNPDETDESGEWRRARLNLSGRLFSQWRYRFEYDFAADTENAVKDSWIGYQGRDGWRLRAGNLQAPQSLEELTSSNSITFMERALPNALVSGYALGVLGETWGRTWGVALGLFDGTIQDSGNDLQEGRAVAGRAYYTPTDSAGRRLHLGISTEYREPEGERRIGFSTRPEIHLSERRLVSTGTLRDVDHVLTTGLEAAGLWGPWSLQGEYLRSDVQRSGRPDVSFHGWYVQGSWIITGGQRDYSPKTGTFLSMRPRGRRGAWELAVRHSALDLEDDPITGGEERNWTLGLNWYVNRNARVMLNWVDGQADPDRDGDDTRIQALQARLQLVF